jgi:3-hydroxybutyryl-CoA dehydrogenase
VSPPATAFYGTVFESFVSIIYNDRRSESLIKIGEAKLRSEHIAVVGAGKMGCEISQIFAAGGHEVILFDLNDDVQEGAFETIRSNLTVLSEHGFCLPEQIEPTMGQIKPAGSLKEAVASARFVVEAITEDPKAKQDLFREIEKLCSPITILASHAAEISVTEIAAKTKDKERVVGTYFWPPSYLIPLVEVAGGRETLKEVMEYTCNILKSVGKYPVLVQKGVPGLIGNRLQHALWREATAIVEQGIADPKTVDEVIKKGLSLCLSVMGPLENADPTGPDQTFQMDKRLLKLVECHLKASEA